jgi:hypothetical protein
VGGHRFSFFLLVVVLSFVRSSRYLFFFSISEQARLGLEVAFGMPWVGEGGRSKRVGFSTDVCLGKAHLIEYHATTSAKGRECAGEQSKEEKNTKVPERYLPRPFDLYQGPVDILEPLTRPHDDAARGLHMCVSVVVFRHEVRAPAEPQPAALATLGVDSISAYDAIRRWLIAVARGTRIRCRAGLHEGEEVGQEGEGEEEEERVVVVFVDKNKVGGRGARMSGTDSTAAGFLQHRASLPLAPLLWLDRCVVVVCGRRRRRRFKVTKGPLLPRGCDCPPHRHRPSVQL